MNVVHGDCLDVMAAMEPESVDAVVTDPPYNLVSGNARYDLALTGAGNPRERRPKGPNGGFMGKAWDGTGIAFRPETWAAALRVAKPSSYLLAFGGTRTVHRMAVAIEDAGWLIRDMLVWAYASGFPKSKASLKPAWEPIVMARKPGPLRMLAIDATRLPVSPTDGQPTSQDGFRSSGAYSTEGSVPWHTDETQVHNPSTLLRAWSDAQPEADSAPLANALADAFVGRGLLGWQGGYPSCPRCDDGLARISEAADREDAPLRPDVPGAPPLREWSLSRIRENRCDAHLSTWDELARVVAGEDVSAYGNDTSSGGRRLIVSKNESSLNAYGDGLNGSKAAGTTMLGRWPANVILTDPIFDGDVDGVVGGGESVEGGTKYPRLTAESMFGIGGYADPDGPRTTDSGTYSRFFLIPKADRGDREPVLGGQLELGPPPASARSKPAEGRTAALGAPRENSHPTVKPTELMRHLVRLVTPAGGTVLDPFLGSGTTGIACELEGFSWIGVEKELEYVQIAEARLNGTQRGLGLVG